MRAAAPSNGRKVKLTRDFVLGLRHPEAEHDHGLLGGVVRVLALDEVDIRVGDAETLGQRDPVVGEQVAYVRQSQIRLLSSSSSSSSSSRITNHE